jgi:hypothetical protein
LSIQLKLVCLLLLLLLLPFQELALLQPYCPGVATTSAMQRTMAVHSNQTPAILASLHPGAPTSSPAAAGAGAVSQDVVLDMVGGSFKAMWEAVGGEAGLRPFLSDCITWAHMSATIGRQLQLEAPKVRQGGGGGNTWLAPE